MSYTNISEGMPSSSGMYITVYKLTDDGEYCHIVHALRHFEDGKWCPDNIDSSNIIAYAGPYEQYKKGDK